MIVFVKLILQQILRRTMYPFAKCSMEMTDSKECVLNGLRSTKSGKRDGDCLYEDMTAPLSKLRKLNTKSQSSAAYCANLSTTSGKSSMVRLAGDDTGFEVPEPKRWRPDSYESTNNNNHMSKALLPFTPQSSILSHASSVPGSSSYLPRTKNNTLGFGSSFDVKLGLSDTTIQQVVERYSGPVIPKSIETASLLQHVCRGVSRADNFGLAKFELGVIERINTAMAQYTEQHIPFTPALFDDILRLSNETFITFLMSYGHAMESVNFNALTSAALAKHFRERATAGMLSENQNKILSILTLGLKPHFESNEQALVRQFYPSYDALLSHDEAMVIDYLLIPLILEKGVMNRTLYQKVDTHKILTHLLAHLDGANEPLPSHAINVLRQLLDKEPEYLDSKLCAQLYRLLQVSAGFSMSEKIASVYNCIMKKFLNSMTLEELKRMHSLNASNATIFHDRIENMVENRQKQIQEELSESMSSTCSEIRPLSCQQSGDYRVAVTANPKPPQLLGLGDEDMEMD